LRFCAIEPGALFLGLLMRAIMGALERGVQFPQNAAMTRIVRPPLLSQSAARFFDCVTDVARYPDFLPWHTAAVDALTVQQWRICERFVSRSHARFPEWLERPLADAFWDRARGLQG